MIASVTGKLINKKPAEATVDVAGVGYHVLVPTSTFERLPPPNESVSLLTYLHVREDALRLYGFSTESERALFKLMIGVAGIGPKLALAALSTMSPADLRQHILGNSPSMLTRIPGVGRKTADRLVIELRDRIANLAMEDAPRDGLVQYRVDALAALETLGLTRATAERRLRIVIQNNSEITSAADLIRLALQE